MALTDIQILVRQMKGLMSKYYLAQLKGDRKKAESIFQTSITLNSRIARLIKAEEEGE